MRPNDFSGSAIREERVGIEEHEVRRLELVSRLGSAITRAQREAARRESAERKLAASARRNASYFIVGASLGAIVASVLYSMVQGGVL